jgi:hypothetical protein
MSRNSECRRIILVTLVRGLELPVGVDSTSEFVIVLLPNVSNRLIVIRQMGLFAERTGLLLHCAFNGELNKTVKSYIRSA